MNLMIILFYKGAANVLRQHLVEEYAVPASIDGTPSYSALVVGRHYYSEDYPTEVKIKGSLGSARAYMAAEAVCCMRIMGDGSYKLSTIKNVINRSQDAFDRMVDDVLNNTPPVFTGKI